MQAGETNWKDLTHTYGFEATLGFPEDKLHPLEAIKGKLIFHVPLIITESKNDDLGLQIELNDTKWEESYSLEKATQVNYWETLRELFPYTEDHILPQYDEYAEDSTEAMWELNGHIYMIVDVKDAIRYFYERGEAEDYCNLMGGHLATITSQEEQDVLVENLQKNGKSNHYWIGGTLDDDQWVWITDEPMEYQNWDTGEPNGSGEFMQIYENGLWDDTYGRNNGVKGYICEWDLE